MFRRRNNNNNVYLDSIHLILVGASPEDVDRLLERFDPPFSTHDVELLCSYVPSIDRKKLDLLVEAQQRVQASIADVRDQDNVRLFLAVIREWDEGLYDRLLAVVANLIAAREEGREDLSTEQRLDFLYKRNEELFEKEKQINQQTDELLRKARQMIAK